MSKSNFLNCGYQKHYFKTTENIFLNLQKTMESVMMEEGGNKYRLPHMAKDKMRKELESMPLTIRCSDEAIDRALNMF